MNFDSKENGENKSFIYEIKEAISFVPMRRMSLWSPIMKRKEIIMRVNVCPNNWMNFNSKENGGKKKKFYESRASMSFILIRRMSL